MIATGISALPIELVMFHPSANEEAVAQYRDASPRPLGPAKTAPNPTAEANTTTLRLVSPKNLKRAIQM